MISFITPLAAALLLYGQPGAVNALPATEPKPFTTAGPEKYVINWVCTGNPTDSQGRSVDIPEVCSNMCYGVYCRGAGSSLYWDKMPGKKGTRATHAGCGSGNRCGKGTYAGRNYQCDEYPFGSTSQSDSNSPMPNNRCVPAMQNNLQSQGLKALYNSYNPFKTTGLGGNPGTFRIAFANAGTTLYCDQQSCTNDGNEYDKNGLATSSVVERGLVDRSPVPTTTYTLTSGMQIVIPGEPVSANTTVFTPRYHNYELMIDMLEAHVVDPDQDDSQYDYMMFNTYFDTDYITDVIG